jgi:hypothetical protein
MSRSPYKNGYDIPYFHPFRHILVVLKVVKFISMAQRNCRLFAHSLFSVNADGVIHECCIQSGQQVMYLHTYTVTYLYTYLPTYLLT